MFWIRKKKVSNDPILEMLNAQTEELKEINNYFKKDRDNLDKEIDILENRLLELGYSNQDLERIKLKSKLSIV